MTLSTNLGFPRIGAKRELKKATESYWKGQMSLAELMETGKMLRERHWTMQKESGIEHVPVGDFSFYDQVLDMACHLGCVPSRYHWDGGNIDLDTYFAMARGKQGDGQDVIAMEMTKWFDTNYHYIVPELEEGVEFKLSSTKIFDEFEEAKALGIVGRPVLVGPLSFLLLSKKKFDSDACRCTLIPGLVAVYIEILQKLQAQGATWVQMDEPFLAMDLEQRYKDAYLTAYKIIRAALPDLNILLATYFEGLRDNLDLAFDLPVNAVHVDLVRAPEQLDDCINAAKKAGKMLSLGLVDGRNIWRNNLSASIDSAEKAIAALGAENVMIAPSCSMLHTPNDLDLETKMDPEIKNWMAYAKQKLNEIQTITEASNEGRDSVSDALIASDRVVQERKTSARIHNAEVKERLAAVTPDMAQRQSPFANRRNTQQSELGLPGFPTTTIGSFPQTQEIRKARAAFKRGELPANDYDKAMKEEIEQVVRYQEDVDIDVLVHGEPERNDMVEYFGEQLSGFTFSKHGWVQSYGSRYVKPPIIFGDVSRPVAMTVGWSQYAQSLTDKKMKGMLTGPITILCWSFVRDDQPRSETCRQIAMAIRDEVNDLEAAGIQIIQIDEPAIREGLPLRNADRPGYLKWAVESFKLSSCGVQDSTQIHTHMCYSEFNDIIDSIGALDADVISIETSRSQMELLDAFVNYKYPNEIGPGVYDIHSPRIPSTEEMVELLEKAEDVLEPDQIWVNPDCGLKTRGWAEVKPALENMVSAAKVMRAKVAASKAA